MKITMGPGKGKKKKTEITQKTFNSPSGRDSDNVTVVKSKDGTWIKK